MYPRWPWLTKGTARWGEISLPRKIRELMRDLRAAGRMTMRMLCAVEGEGFAYPPWQPLTLAQYQANLELGGSLVDLDDDLLEFARQSQPSITWVHADLATMRLGQRFGMVAMPGNVMMFCRPTDRQAIIENAAAHLEPDGLLVAGFQLEPHRDSVTLVEYDRRCAESGFELVERWSTWQGQPYREEPYAVSVHRHGGSSSS